MDTPKIRVAATRPLKILTFNTASFNFGPSWHRKADGLSFHSTIRVELIKEMIAQSQPDFLCLQESVLTAASAQAKGGVTSSSTTTSSTAAGDISKKAFPGCLGDLGAEWCLVGDPSTTHAHCTVLLARRSFFEEDQGDPSDGHHRTTNDDGGDPRFVKATAVVSAASQRPGSSSTGVRRTTTGAPPSSPSSSSMIRGNDFPIGVFRVPLIADTNKRGTTSATTQHDDKSPRPSASVTLAISSVHLAPMKENAKARAGQMNTVLKSLFSAAVSSSQKSSSSFPSSFSACVVAGDFNMRSEEHSVPVSLSSSTSSPWTTEDTLFAAATRHPTSSCLFENETPFSSGDDDTTPPIPAVKLNLHGTFGGRNEYNGPHPANEGKDLLSEDATDEMHFLSSESGLRYDRVVVGVRNNSAASRGRGSYEVASSGGTSGAAVMKKKGGEEEEGGELRVVVKKYQVKGTKRVDPKLVKSEMDKVPIEEMDQILARQPKSVRDAMKKRQMQSGKPPTIEAIATMQRQNAALFERPQGLYLSDHVGVLVELQFETFADLL